MLHNFKRILVPTDFSACADNALRYACWLASILNSKITIVHAYDELISSDVHMIATKEYLPRGAKESKRQLHQAIASLSQAYPTVAFENEVVPGWVDEVIVDVSHKKKIDLVVMGTSVHLNANDFFVGSKTAQMISHLKTAVLVIPENADFRPIHKILYATNFEYEDVDAISSIIALAEVFEAEIQIVHISTDKKPRTIRHDEEIMEWFEEITQKKVKYKHLTFKTIVSGASMISEMENLVYTNHIDLMAMSTTGKTFLKRLFEGSLSRELSYKTEIPLLVFHIEASNNLNQ